MSRINKRKHVQLEALRDDFSHPTENQQIVRILHSRGNNLHEVESTDKSTFLVSMPTKFRKNVWVKRGNFVLVEPIEEGNKVKAEIVRILTKQHIKYFRDDNVWPKEFIEGEQETYSNADDMFVNTNRPAVSHEESESESSDDNGEYLKSENANKLNKSEEDSDSENSDSSEQNNVHLSQVTTGGPVKSGRNGLLEGSDDIKNNEVV